MKYIYLLFAMCAMVACSEQSPQTTPTLDLVGKEVRYDTVFTVSHSVDLVGDFVVFSDLYAYGDVFHIYDRKSRKYLKSYGQIGDGPDEISQLGFFHIDGAKNTLYFVDAGKRQINQLNLDSVIQKEGYTPQRIPYPEDFPYLMHFGRNADGTFITQSTRGTETLLFHFDELGIIGSFGDNNLNDDPLIFDDFYGQFSYYIAKHPTEDRYVCTYKHYDYLRLVDWKSKEEMFIQGPARITYADNSERQSGFKFSRITDRHIYAPYVGDSYMDPETGEFRVPNRILVYDWNGNQVAILAFDQPIKAFTVDQQANRIILMPDDEEDVVYHYDLDIKILKL